MRNTSEESKAKIQRHGQLPTSENSNRYLNLVIGGGFQKAGHMAYTQLTDLIDANHLRVQFVDTDANRLMQLPQNVRFLMNDTRAAALLTSIARSPNRFPGWESLGDLRKKWKSLGTAESLPAGLMTHRDLGPLVMLNTLWRKSDAIRNFLLNPIRELQQYRSSLCYFDFAERRTQRLIITYQFSCCGGTGSSLALQLEDLHQYFLRNDEGYPLISFMADILLPGPMLHSANDPQALKANAYACLSEISARYANPAEPIQMGRYRVPRTHRPFEFPFIYNDTNLRGRTLTSRDQINDMMFVVWQLRNIGIEGQEFQSRLVDYHLEYPNIYSSAGACILEYPCAVIEMECALRSGAAWIRAQPLFSTSEDEAQQTATSYLDRLLNQHTGLREIDALTRNAKGKPIKVSFSAIKNVPRAKLPQAIDQVAQQQLSEFATTLADMTNQHAAKLSAAIIRSVQDQCNLKGGFQVATIFLRQMQHRLDEYLKEIEGLVHQTVEQRKRQEERVAEQQNASRWSRVGLNYRSKFVMRHQRLLETSANELRQRARLELTTRLLEQVNQLSCTVEGWTVTLAEFEQYLMTKLKDQRSATLAEKSVAVRWVVCPDDIDQLYETDLAATLRSASSGLAFRWHQQGKKLFLNYQSSDKNLTDQWSILSEAGVANHVAHFRQFWTHLRKHSVESILAQKGEQPEKVLESLMHDAAPLISIDQTIQLPPEKMMNILASETNAFWDEMVGQTGLSIVATGNPHRTSLLSVVLGINPLEGLMQSAAWEQACDEQVAAGKSPYIYPDFDPRTLDPTWSNNDAGNSSNHKEKEESHVTQ